MSSVEDDRPDLGGDDILAAEYVVGVLGEDERRAVAARIESDPSFARLVDRWEVSLSPLAAAYPEAAVPERVKVAIDRRLFAAAAGATADKASAPSLWSSLAFWRGLSAVAVAVAVAIAVASWVMPPSYEGAQRYVASLAPQQSDVHYFVVYDARTHELGLSHVTGARPEGHDFQLWMMMGEGKEPMSLGVIPEGQSVLMPMVPDMNEAIAAGTVFAISLEPSGGSPTGQPTGPVVAVGGLHNV